MWCPWPSRTWTAWPSDLPVLASEALPSPSSLPQPPGPQCAVFAGIWERWSPCLASWLHPSPSLVHHGAHDSQAGLCPSGQRSCLCPSGHLPATYHPPPRGCFRLWVFSIFSFWNIQDTASEESFLLLKMQRAPSNCFLELKKKKYLSGCITS